MTDESKAENGGWRGKKLRLIVIVINVTVGVFFTLFHAATWTAPKHIRDLARNFAIEKAVEFTAPHAERLEELLESSPDDASPAAQSIREELAHYRADPKAYMNDLIDGAPGPADPEQPRGVADIIQDLPEEKRSVTNIVQAVMEDPVATFRTEARKFYQDTIAALLRDLRIFSAANIIAALAAALTALFAQGQRLVPVVWFSILMLTALGYNIYLYVDSMTFFQILTRAHMGWSYPVLLAVITLKLLWNHGQLGVELRETLSDEKESA